MNIYTRTMQLIQKTIIKYLKDKEPIEEEERFSKLVECEDIKKDIEILKGMLHILSVLSINHHRSKRFFNKIERITIYYKDHIQALTNQQLFEIFKKSKRVLLFLFKQQLLIPDSYIFEKISKPKYSNSQNYLAYFYAEFKSFMTPRKQKEILQTLPKIEIYENLRQEGENESYICKLIRNDSIQDFVTFINQTPQSISTQIIPSIFETNAYLNNKKNLNLIEYAAFFGSFQIFQYLYKNGVKISSNLWIYAIHGKNPEIIHLLEEILNNPSTKNYSTFNHQPNNWGAHSLWARQTNINKQVHMNTTSDQKYTELYRESVICHHNKIAKYFLDNFIQIPEDLHTKCSDLYYATYNYQLINSNIKASIHFLIKYDYLYFIRYQILKNKNKVIETLSKPILKKPNFLASGSFSKSIPYLIYSIKKGNCEAVQCILNLGNINVNDPYKVQYDSFETITPPLILAIENGNRKIIDILLSNPKIDPNAKKITNINSNSYGTHNYNRTNYLINDNFSKKVINCKYSIHKAGVIVEAISPHNDFTIEKTALQVAFELNNLNIFEKLLSNEKINVNQKIMNQKYNKDLNFSEQKTLIHIVTNKRNELFFSKILEKRNDVDINELQTIELTRSNNKRITVECKTPLYIALDSENYEIANILLSNENILIDKKIKICNFIQNSNTILIDEKNVFHLEVEKENTNMIDKLMSTGKIDINECITTSIDEYSQYYSQISNFNHILTSKAPLHIAILSQKYNLVHKLLEYENCDINSIYYRYDKKTNIEENAPSLFLAFEKSTTDIIELLLQNDSIDINKKTIYKLCNKIVQISSPFYKALFNKNQEHVKFLLDRPDLLINDKFIMKKELKSKENNYNFKKTFELTPLYYAVEYCNEDIVKMLMESDSEIDVNSKSTIKTKPLNSNTMNQKASNKEITALQYAVEKNKINIIQLLINYKQIDVNTKSITKIEKTIIKNDNTITKKNTINSTNQTISKTNNSNEIFENEIIENTPLSIAIINGYVQVVSLLLQHIKINYNDKVIIKKTINENQLNKKTKITDEKSILSLAADTNNNIIIQNLLNMPKIKANDINNYSSQTIINGKINSKNIQQRTALSWAVMNNKLISVQCLLNDKKVNPNLVLLFSNTSLEKKVAFHIAIENEFIEILKLLIENVNIDLRKIFVKKESQNYTEEPIVYFAVKNGKIESLKNLLSNSKIDINDTSKFIDYENKCIVKRSAFQFANKLDDYDMINLLAEKNAEIKYEKIPLID